MSLRDKIEHAIQNQPCTVKDLKDKSTIDSVRLSAIITPDPEDKITMYILYGDRKKAEWMGENARNRLAELNISWEHVLRRLLA